MDSYWTVINSWKTLKSYAGNFTDCFNKESNLSLRVLIENCTIVTNKYALVHTLIVETLKTDVNTGQLCAESGDENFQT